jgi:hypothetical protein
MRPTACGSHPCAIAVALQYPKGNLLRGAGPPGRLCLSRLSIQPAPTKTPGALTPGRRPAPQSAQVAFGLQTCALTKRGAMSIGDLPMRCIRERGERNGSHLVFDQFRLRSGGPEFIPARGNKFPSISGTCSVTERGPVPARFWQGSAATAGWAIIWYGRET